MSTSLQQFLIDYRGRRGIYSVCSTQRWVIEAAMQQALDDDVSLLIEATSNQVNQEGGYTGMTPATYRTYVSQVASGIGFSEQKIIFGGDHLGPNPWRHLAAKEAMERAAIMVRDYVAAGFTKIHLDASMPCLGDPPALSDATVANRAAILCHAAESTAREAGLSAPIYIIGTEVPSPGGATHEISGLEVTSLEALDQTLAVHRKVFAEAELQGAWRRVIALVVQPGVEFDHDTVIEYDAAKATHLKNFLERNSELVFEAHSTDYQRPPAYTKLIRDGFAILKVGPALSFAMREALFALARIERELISEAIQSRLLDVMEKAMLAKPIYWEKYYLGSKDEQQILRRYSYSDRIRYYWNQPEVEQSVQQLLTNFATSSIPETILSQYLPQQYDAIRSGEITANAGQIIRHKIRAAIRPYSSACLGHLPLR